jgi:hypothetical protein
LFAVNQIKETTAKSRAKKIEPYLLAVFFASTCISSESQVEAAGQQ